MTVRWDGRWRKPKAGGRKPTAASKPNSKETIVVDALAITGLVQSFKANDSIGVIINAS